MNITLSVATSCDGYIDDRTSTRLILSTLEDWQEVYQLRADVDAILIGAQTLRLDNPRIRIKSEELVNNRIKRGMSAEPTKVIVSGRGELSPDLKLFTHSKGNIILFSNIERAKLEEYAEVIVSDKIDAAYIITELEKRGICNLFVEGGVKVLDMFISEREFTTLRLARNPLIEVSDSLAPHFNIPDWIKGCPSQRYDLGGMEIINYTIDSCDRQKDAYYMQRAIELSKQCVPAPTSYCVGAVVVTKEGEVFEGYTHETSPTHHAEQEAIDKAEKSGASLRGATMYSSMEPCSKRASEPESCSQIAIRLGFSRALFALYEPNHFVACEGALNMRRAGVKVECMSEFASAVKYVNRHILSV